MSLVAAFALAASTVTLPNCSWDKPGVNPFMGDLVAAVDRYKDIPAATRAKLKARMAARQYDEIVDIHRDSIVGRYEYGSEIRDMHFGAGSVCRTVTRTKWTAQTLERGLVYCEDGQCILVPTVCRNVSRIARGPLKPAAAGGPISGGAFNPAVGTGPILVHAVLGGGTWANLWLYLVGPLAGGAIAAWIFGLQEREPVQLHAEPSRTPESRPA